MQTHRKEGTESVKVLKDGSSFLDLCNAIGRGNSGNFGTAANLDDSRSGNLSYAPRAFAARFLPPLLVVVRWWVRRRRSEHHSAEPDNFRIDKLVDPALHRWGLGSA